ncbi:MAG: YitT family protein [Oscillospiraceae bacterium]|nr:YitT family protein [Oscillospiraceae bacterium]
MKRLQENRLGHILRKYLVITVGAVIYAVGFQFFLYPNNITSGGVVGTSMIINQLTGFPVGVMTILLNVPLFIIAWRHFGLDFLIGSLVGMGLSSVLVDVFASSELILTDDPMLAAVIGGVVKGMGLGMIYYVGGTTGGIDIVVKILRRKLASVNFGTIMLALDTIIIAVYAMVLGRYESAMYSLIAMYVTTKVVDLVLYGIDNACLCYIISNSTEEITKEIVSGPLHRGVTLLEGRGAYSGTHREVMMCVIKRQQIGQLKRLVRNVDEKAFFIVTNAKNVFGNGFESFTEVR